VSTPKSSFFASRLKTLRGTRSQAEFAVFLGIGSQQAYQRYEGGRIPRMDVLSGMAHRLGVSVDSLICEEGSEWTIKGIGKVDANGYVNVPPKLLAEWLACAIERDDWKTVHQMSALLNAVSEENLKRQNANGQPPVAEEKKEGDKP
jgi:transcriptional regulator with XRE-family HTH domain